jgi:hypothetical protein
MKPGEHERDEQHEHDDAVELLLDAFPGSRVVHEYPTPSEA